MKKLQKKRKKRPYPGVYIRKMQNGDTAFYVSYRVERDGKLKQIHERVGLKSLGMDKPVAYGHRLAREAGKELPNKEQKEGRRDAAQKNQNWTISTLWDAYREANPDLKGYGVYTPIFNAHLKAVFGDRQPKDITPLDINRLKKLMRGKSDKSIANALELLRRIVNFGIKMQLCPGTGFIIQLPRVYNQKTEDLTPKQTARLLEVIDRHIEYRSPYRVGAYMMMLVLYTGLRRGEMLRLKWTDIDWHRKNILIRDAKSGRDEIIPLSSYSEKLFKMIQELEPGDSSFVFPGINGGQRSDIRRPVNEIKVEAELPKDFRALHGLRHVFASGLISRGVSKDIVARLLTHKGQTVTDRYAHIRDDALQQAAELAGQIVEETRNS